MKIILIYSILFSSFKIDPAYLINIKSHSFFMSNFENLPVIAIGSKNPVKINAAKLGFEKIYRQKLNIADDETIHINCVGIDVPR